MNHTRGGKSQQKNRGFREHTLTTGWHPFKHFRSKKKLSLFGFLSLMAAMVVSVHEYPTFAVAGMQIPFFLIVTGLFWFLPVALCSAEMATVKGWEDGGIFTWVSKMLNERFGFAAVFFQWLQITVCFVVIIYFLLGALSSLLDMPVINDNPAIKCLCVLVVFWGSSLMQLLGIRKTSGVAKLGILFGVIAPTMLLLILSAVYLVSGAPLMFDTEPTSFLPDFTQASTLVVLVSFLFANMGAEASASHINEMRNPRKDYPLAMLLLVLLATIMNAIGGFAVAGIVPLEDLSMSSGIVQTFEGLAAGINLDISWLVKLVCCLLILGVLGEVGSWIVGPSRALYTAAERGLLPRRFLGLNKNGVPTRIIIMQAVMVSIWAVVLTLGGGGNNLSFLAALSLTTLIYLASYLLLFIAYLKLLSHGEHKRGFHVPGGMPGKLFFAISGLLSSAYALVIAFFPPVVIAADQDVSYTLILSGSFITAVALPFIIYQIHGKKHHHALPHPVQNGAHGLNRLARLSGRGEHLLPSERTASSASDEKPAWL